MRAAQRRDGKLQRDAERHRKQHCCPRDPVGAIPKAAIGARAFIAKSIDGVRSHPTEHEWQRIESGKNWKCKKKKHNLLF